MSASNSKASGKLRVRARVPTMELSIEDLDQSAAPRSAARSAICKALRVVVPCCSMRDVKLARPGLPAGFAPLPERSEEHTSELQSRGHLVCRLLLEKKKIT